MCITVRIESRKVDNHGGREGKTEDPQGKRTGMR